MVTHTDVQFPDGGGLQSSINRVTRKDDNVYFDALGLAETLFDDHMAANMLVLGAAYQAGAIPVSAAAIEEAIKLNAVAVAMNTHAFRAGPAARGRSEPGCRRSSGTGWARQRDVDAPLTPAARALVDRVGRRRRAEAPARDPRARADRLPGRALCRDYVDFVTRVRAAEQAAVPGETRLSEAVARYLFKLMAYKDEYEVARLHLQADLARSLAEEFPGGVRVQYNLHPPLLRALGLTRKLKFGSWFDGAFRALARMKGLRGTALDPVRPRGGAAAWSGRCPASTASSSSARWAACRSPPTSARSPWRGCPISSAATRTSSWATSRSSARRSARSASESLASSLHARTHGAEEVHHAHTRYDCSPSSSSSARGAGHRDQHQPAGTLVAEGLSLPRDHQYERYNAGQRAPTARST